VGYEDNNSQWDRWVHGGTGKDAFQYRLPGYESDELINLFIRYLRERGGGSPRRETEAVLRRAVGPGPMRSAAVPHGARAGGTLDLLGSVWVENRHGLIVDALAMRADGRAEVDAALLTEWRRQQAGS
jgi:hypothetical protein